MVIFIRLKLLKSDSWRRGLRSFVYGWEVINKLVVLAGGIVILEMEFLVVYLFFSGSFYIYVIEVVLIGLSVFV